MVIYELGVSCANRLGLGTINYLDYTPTGVRSEENIELPREHILVFATKSLGRKVFFRGEKRYALQNLYLVKCLSRLNYPIVIVGKESQLVAKMLSDSMTSRVIPIGYVCYETYLKVLQKARAIVLLLFGWRSGVSIKLLDALSYGNVVITSRDAARAFPRLSKAPFVAKSFKELIEKVETV